MWGSQRSVVNVISDQLCNSTHVSLSTAYNICSIKKKNSINSAAQDSLNSFRLESFSIKKNTNIPVIKQINANDHEICEFRVNRWPPLSSFSDIGSASPTTSQEVNKRPPAWGITNSNYASHSISKEIKCIMTSKAFWKNPLLSLSNQITRFHLLVFLLHSGKTKNVPRWKGFALDNKMSVLKVH